METIQNIFKEIAFILSFTLGLQNTMCTLYLQHVSNQTSYILLLSSHMWLLVIVLGHTAINNDLLNFWQCLHDRNSKKCCSCQ